MPALAAFDWICLLTLLVSLLTGLWRGLLYEAISLAGWVSAFILSGWLGPLLGQALPMAPVPDTLRAPIGMTLVFIAVVFMGNFFAWLTRRMANAVGLRPADRALGAAFGLLRALALLLLAVALAQHTALHTQPWWQASLGVQGLQALLHWLAPWLPAWPELPELPRLPAWPEGAPMPATPSTTTPALPMPSIPATPPTT